MPEQDTLMQQLNETLQYYVETANRTMHLLSCPDPTTSLHPAAFNALKYWLNLDLGKEEFLRTISSVNIELLPWAECLTRGF